MIKNIFYFHNINSIGGVESFLWYMAQKYGDRDIAVYYQTGSEEQLRRLRRLVRVVKFEGQIIECEKAFFNYNPDIISWVKAKEYIGVIHADFIAIRGKPFLNPRITKYIGVSKQACESFTKLTGLKCELCYNPIVLDKPKRVLNLISATRLTYEKGKARIEKFARLLEEAGIPYIWTIFTNNTNEIKNPNIIYRKPELSILDYIANSDYLVQLSDSESYCYSVVESLMLGTPVIVTDCPVFRKEIGVKDGVNGFIVDFKLEKVNIKDIYEKELKFDYKPPEDNWDKVLAKGKSTYQEELKTMVKVRCMLTYYDMELLRYVKEHEEFEVNLPRADYLIKRKLVIRLE